MKKNYIFLADGFEEIEAITVIDMLRRANIDIVIISVHDRLQVTGAHNLVVTADKLLSDEKFASIGFLILPGGGTGVKNLNKCIPLTELLERHFISNGKIAAICSAPSILGGLGLLTDKKATCYPGFEGYLTEAQFTGSTLEVSDNIITSNGAASATVFATAIIQSIAGKEKVKQVLDEMLFSAQAWVRK